MGGDTPLEGRIEIFLLGHWGTVCDYNWDLADATVVCRALGYLKAVGAPGFAAFGAGSGPSWYSYVGCEGDEQGLTECSRSSSDITGSACSHSRDAGVACSSESSSIPNMNNYCFAAMSWHTMFQSIAFHAEMHTGTLAMYHIYTECNPVITACVYSTPAVTSMYNTYICPYFITTCIYCGIHICCNQSPVLWFNSSLTV